MNDLPDRFQRLQPLPLTAPGPRRRERGATRGTLALLLVGLLFLVGLARKLAPSWRAKPAPPPPPNDQRPPTAEALRLYDQVAALPTGLTAPAGLTVGPNGDLYLVGDGKLLVLSPTGELRREVALGSVCSCVCVAPDQTVYVGLQGEVARVTAQGEVVERWAMPHPQPMVTGLAADDQGVWIADAGERAVWRAQPGQGLVERLGEAPGGEGAPEFVVPSPHFDVAPAPEGGVWVANPGRHRLEHYAADGRKLSQWGQASFRMDGFQGCCNPADFAMLPDGRFVTSEKGRPRIKLYDAKGWLLGVVAATEDLPAAAVKGLDVVATPDGRILALDPVERTVRVYAPREGT